MKDIHTSVAHRWTPDPSQTLQPYRPSRHTHTPTPPPQNAIKKLQDILDKGLQVRQSLMLLPSCLSVVFDRPFGMVCYRPGLSLLHTHASFPPHIPQQDRKLTSLFDNKQFVLIYTMTYSMCTQARAPHACLR